MEALTVLVALAGRQAPLGELALVGAILHGAVAVSALLHAFWEGLA